MFILMKIELQQKKIDSEKTLNEIEKKDSQTQNLITNSQEIIACKIKEREGLLITIIKVKAETSLLEERERDFLATLKMLEETLDEQARALQLKKEQITDGQLKKKKQGMGEGVRKK